MSLQGLVLDRMGLYFDSAWAGIDKQIPNADYNARLQRHTRVMSTLTGFETAPSCIRETLPEDLVEEFSPSDGFSNIDRLSLAEAFKYATYCYYLTGGAADLTNKDIGMLTQRIKASNAGYAPAQVRMVLLCDTKLAKRMMQQSDNKIVFDMFLAATKRLGILPLKSVESKETSASTPATKPSHGQPPKDKSPIPSKQVKSVLKLDPKAWNVPIKGHEEIRPDVNAVAMISDSSLACQLYNKCRHSNSTIALVAPRDLAINGCRPTMAIIPFIQSQEGLPDRSIDLQVWVHCISSKPLQPITKREVVHVSLQDKHTSVMRCHIPSALIQGFDSLSFSKANKTLQISTISSLLDEDQKHVIDAWKITWDPSQNSYTCFIRVPSSKVKDLLSKSKPSSIILDVPLDFKEKVSIVWLKKAGSPLETSEVQILMHEFRHLGVFCKQGTWAIRAEPEVAKNIRNKLGQDGTPSFSVSGLPVEFIESEVKEFCSKLGWRVTVDSHSRRCRSGKASWIVRSEDSPPTSSTYLFSDFQRYRISITSTRKAPKAPTVTKTANDFQFLSFESQAKALRPPRSQDDAPNPPSFASVAKGKGKGKSKHQTVANQQRDLSDRSRTPRPVPERTQLDITDRLAATEQSIQELKMMMTHIMAALQPSASAPTYDPDDYMSGPSTKRALDEEFGENFMG